VGAISYGGGIYFEGFDTLSSDTTGNPHTWTDDSTIIGWYSTRTTYLAGTGSNNTGALYSFGATNASERALGSIGSNATGNIIYGARLINTTSATITEFTLAYTGEQWRNGGNTTPHSLLFSYSDSATSLTVGAYTSVAALDFTGPVATATAGALDGNNPANQAALNATVSGISWEAGTELWFRWADANDAGNDHGLAIDDVNFTTNAPVPEPSTLTLFALGTLIATSAAYRRRTSCSS
jgi:hypothetical protein